MEALVALLLASCGGDRLPPGNPGTPDVVLVSVDTLRADHVGAWGYARPTTPFIDALAARGLRYARARAPAPWTLPSHATLLTGRLPARHGAVEDDVAIGSDTPLLAEGLRSRGVATLGVVSSLFVSSRYGFDRGFDAFEDFGIRTPAENLAGETDAREVVDAVLRLGAALPPGRPAFVFVHFYDAHYAYDPPAPYATLFDRAPTRRDPAFRTYAWHLAHPPTARQLEHQIAQYDEAIRYVDDAIRRLSKAWETAGRTATWIVTSDHGEEFGERGSWGHGHTLFQEQLHVPLVVAGARVPVGVVQDAVGLQDLAPRIAAWFGADLPSPDGTPLTCSDPGPTDPGSPRRAFPSETSRFRTDRYALYRDGLRLGVDLATGRRTLYDLEADPGELEDLAGVRPDLVAELETLLWTSYGAPWTTREAVDLESRGTFLVESQAAAREIRLEAGRSFQVVPVDARVRVPGRGPWRPFGGAAPGSGDPVSWAGEAAAVVTLSEADRARLEALGYVPSPDDESAP
ncbi:MAG: sulfatase [Deltaproteobacteria bacterium]|nr:sulfatase [Deltaproteobacteria bacterium]